MSCRLYLSQFLQARTTAQMFRLPARSIRVSSQTYDSKWKLNKLWSGKTEEENFAQLEEEASELEVLEKQMEDFSRETDIEELRRKRNKSRLSASDKNLLHGVNPPEKGLKYSYGKFELSKEYRRSMLAQYGSEKTGVDPAMSWPTSEELRLAADWERLYQDKPLVEQIAEVNRDIEQRKAKRMAREKDIEDSLNKMDTQIKQWRHRVNTKNKQAEMERGRRERVLAELREEFGYNVNPLDNYMKERIAEREKALIKEEKELKKAQKKDRQAATK